MPISSEDLERIERFSLNPDEADSVPIVDQVWPVIERLLGTGLSPYRIARAIAKWLYETRRGYISEAALRMSIVRRTPGYVTPQRRRRRSTRVATASRAAVASTQIPLVAPPPAPAPPVEQSASTPPAESPAPTPAPPEGTSLQNGGSPDGKLIWNHSSAVPRRSLKL